MKDEKNKIIIISGATATGKTSLSLKIAQEIESEIVNFDSLLFYKELSIGVAKPTIEEISKATHHFVSSHSIQENLNAHIYSKLAIKKINEIISRKKTPILVGGSGFYLQAIVQGMYESSSVSKDTLERSQELYVKDGIYPFLKILQENDLKSFERYHENDHYRIRRAVEYFWDNHKPLSQARVHKDKENEQQNQWPQNIYKWNPLHFYLNIPKLEHHKIIEKRTRKMIDEGLIEEVQGLLKTFPKDLKPLQSIGYKETIAYLEGKFSSKEDFIERIIISTRQLAKAQRTWFNKKEKLEFNPLVDGDKLKEIIKKSMI